MKKFAVFDLDGTLIRWQLYHSITDKLAAEGALGPKAYANIKKARLVWKRRESNHSFHDYEMTVLNAYESALKSIPVSVFDTLVTQVITQYKDQVYTYTRDLIKTLQAQDYFLIAISGSHHELVEKIAQYYQFDDFVGTKYQRVGNTFGTKTYAPSLDKKSALQTFITANNLTLKDSYAVGDSGSDASMLEMVEHPIAFNPDQNLYKIAQKNKWPIVIERKNMVYKLEPVHEHYILV